VNTVSKKALSWGLKNPVFTIGAVLNYWKLRKDVLYIKKEINRNFSKEEKNKFAHGASAGIKEVALYRIIRKEKPDLVVETGVAQGVSTYFILKALEDNNKGRLISIDYPNYEVNGYLDEEKNVDRTYIPKGKSPGWLVKDKSRWTLLIGKSLSLLPSIEKMNIDVFFHDSDHSYTNMQFELEWAISHMAKGIIIADDTSKNHAWKEFVAKNKVKELHYPLSSVRIQH
jgi:hypothetical protein